MRANIRLNQVRKVLQGCGHGLILARRFPGVSERNQLGQPATQSTAEPGISQACPMG
jgi:hypothetical protein